MREDGDGSALELVAVGDIMLGRDVAASGGDGAADLLAADVREWLRGDLVTGNLECLLTEAVDANPLSHSAFRASPAFALPLLRLFDVVTLANNHVYDFLDPGIEDTLAHLREMDVGVVGVGRTEVDALMPQVRRIRGMSVAVFGMATAVNLTPEPSRFVVARPDAAALDAIRAAASAHDQVIVHLHAGGGDVPYPAPEVRRLHERLLGAGADLVLGHHPHRVQGWIQSGRRAAFFSLGDFVFDRRDEGRDEALVVRAKLADDALGLTVIPVVRGADHTVAEARGERRSRIEDRLRGLNALLGSGESDRRYLATYDAKARIRSLAADLRAGGPAAVVRRLRGAGVRRGMTFLGALLAGVRRRR